MNKPTEEQIKKFWEWCEQYRICGYCHGSGRDYVSETAYSSCHACGGNGHFHPDLDLNSLFKYAVPKLMDIFPLDEPDEYSVRDILEMWIDKIVWANQDPALTLFWVIWEVICPKTS